MLKLKSVLGQKYKDSKSKFKNNVKPKKLKKQKSKMPKNKEKRKNVERGPCTFSKEIEI